MDLNNQNYQEHIIGFIIRYERKKKKLKLEDFSNIIGVSKQHLSEIENGRKNLNKHTIDKIFDALDIAFNWEIDEQNELPNLFNDYIHTYVGVDQKKRKEQSQLIIQNEKWKYSFYYPIVLLTEFSSLVLEDSKGNIDEVMEKCEKIFSLFDNEQQAIYYYFKGLHEHIDHDNFQLGEEYYQKSIQCNPFGEICGMAYYQMCIICYCDFRLLNSLDSLKKAKNILEKNHDYRRVVGCEIAQGQIYGTSNLFSSMEKQYLKALKLSNDFCFEEQNNMIYFNLTYGLTIAKQYEKAIHYGEQYLSAKYRTGDFCAMLAWCHYQLHQLKDCQYYLSLLEKNNDSICEDSKVYVDGLRYLLKGNYTAYYNKLVKYYNKVKDCSGKLNAVMALKHIIDYCEKNEMYEEGFKYQKELIQLTKFQ